LADNLSDIWTDIFRTGYVNVPEEEIENLRGLEIERDKLKGVDPMELAIKKDYLLEKEKEVKLGFKRAEELFMSIKQRIEGVNEERLTLLMNFAHSWPLEIKRIFKL
jgi:hypothetical protein